MDPFERLSDTVTYVQRVSTRFQSYLRSLRNDRIELPVQLGLVIAASFTFPNRIGESGVRSGGAGFGGKDLRYVF